ncbi:MAG: Asp-tRNA(Asn)/Glu-tRNA(Gln) amidotransferase subunit GatB [Spirochaetaceae bacterium]|nr:Asp-tRNA(Asn)/Glu-tRNA(Gln) amidotransferase subunit GatB [Spirochaetaceae bacterium]
MSAARADAGAYDTFVGLEIHIQLDTRTKVFCGCPVAFGGDPNTRVCPICLGFPGVLPALNREAARMAYVVAQAVGCTLSTEAVFERKNYFYPDLPKNYQISQYGAPIGAGGSLTAPLSPTRPVAIREVHLEEDAGKMIHAGDVSLLDFNRSGTPLVEIVTAPELRSGDDAIAFLQYFRRVVRHLGVCDGNMEEGSLRCDANVSINHAGAGLGSKVEIKNINSFKFVGRAIEFELDRQRRELEAGRSVRVETRHWNENRDVTTPMRVKESDSDYRYFPEPDLPPLRPDASFLESVDAAQVELPMALRDRLAAEHGLSGAQAEFLSEERATAELFERAVAAGADAQQAARWLAGDVRRLLNRTGMTLAQSPLSAARLGELLELIDTGAISGKIAKGVLESVLADDLAPAEVVERQGLRLIADEAELGGYVDAAIAAFPEAAAQMRQGDGRPVGFLIGEVMKRTGGRAAPEPLRRMLQARIGGE